MTTFTCIFASAAHHGAPSSPTRRAPARYWTPTMPVRHLLTVVLLASLSACGGGEAPPAASADSAQRPLLLVPEDVVTAEHRAFGQGPVVSGSLQPEQSADLRAEVSGVVVEVLRDDGDSVQAGDLLVRIDPSAHRDQLLSAESAVRSATDALDQARRQLERMQTLAEKGLIPAQNLEEAESRRNQAQSELASARARAVEARQQVERTEVRAPFDGVVSGRQVSGGDTVQVGRELLKVMVPGSMRFEGLIAADQVGRVSVGDPVEFRVNGYPGRTFSGTVARVDPVANVATRQVQVIVSIDGSAMSDVSADAPALVAGLYAEGRIEVERRQVVTAPASAVIREGDAAWVWTVADGTLHRQSIEAGEQDSRTGLVEIVAGLQPGDGLLRRPIGALRDGAPVQVGGATAASPAPGGTGTDAAQSQATGGR